MLSFSALAKADLAELKFLIFSVLNRLLKRVRSYVRQETSNTTCFFSIMNKQSFAA